MIDIKTLKFVVFAILGLFVFHCAAEAQVKLRNAIDFDGDAKADVTVYRQLDSTFNVNKSNGGATTQQFGISNFDTVTPGDYDGDGKGDLAVWRYTDRVWYRINSSTGTFTAVQFGLVGDELVQRDYDGDGKTDIAIVRRTGTAAAPGAMVWWVNRSSTGATTAYQFGINTDFAVPGDYDGDGKFDYAVYRPGANSTTQSTYYINRSTDNGFTIQGWGVGGDWVVPGDYDGDGKTDLAVARRGALVTDPITWYSLRSSDGNLIAKNFGITEYDTPIQNDYDGDNITDHAVWRETNATFYILKTTGGGATTFSPWGYSTDSPIAAYDVH
ncbi:MAG TPA: VCBS repeat-containing protein [Pyrinomonadaceae bacterium]|nr:VCBS repeat-containing protein [Pyrinomonadaceae bacterium]